MKIKKKRQTNPKPTRTPIPKPRLLGGTIFRRSRHDRFAQQKIHLRARINAKPCVCLDGLLLGSLQRAFLPHHGTLRHLCVRRLDPRFDQFNFLLRGNHRLFDHQNSTKSRQQDQIFHLARPRRDSLHPNSSYTEHLVPIARAAIDRNHQRLQHDPSPAICERIYPSLLHQHMLLVLHTWNYGWHVDRTFNKHPLLLPSRRQLLGILYAARGRVSDTQVGLSKARADQYACILYYQLQQPADGKRSVEKMLQSVRNRKIEIRSIFRIPGERRDQVIRNPKRLAQRVRKYQL